MSPAPRAAATDSTSSKAGRQTISITADAVTKLDALIERTAQALKASAGIAVSVTRAQMVESLIAQAHAVKPDAEPAGE